MVPSSSIRYLTLNLGALFARLGVILLTLCLPFCSEPASAQAVDESSLSRTDSEIRTATSAADLEFFEKQIRPIFVDHCLECHSGSETNGGLSLDSREQMLKGGDLGSVLNLAHPSESLLLAAISYRNKELQMPPKNKLSDQQIALLAEWVTRGAPDPRKPPNSGEESRKSGPMGMSLEEGLKFWSMQPVSPKAIPQVKNADWIRTPIDAFLLHQLESHGLSPASQADKRTLIRRLSLDLVGIPPTPDEVEQFAADSSSDAYANLVERLLASPQYGVRWGRHWLDVARYADSNGLDENLAYGNAWRYRDYVVHAMNSDKPYHRFVAEQIAGDLLPEANQETKIATGFLSLGAKVLAEPDMEKLVMDTIDEQVDSLGKAFLGMTFGCTRCHDHKFDPVTQRDYYALAAIFKSTRTFANQRFGAIKYWYEHGFPDPVEAEKLKSVEAAIAAAKDKANQFKAQAMAKIRNQAQSQAADYLAAAARLSLGATLVEVANVAEPLGLHPRMLYHCRSHVENQKNSDFYQAWHHLATNSEAVKQHYSDLFSRVKGALDAAKQPNPNATTLTDPELEKARQELVDPSGFLVVPPQPEFAFDASTLEEYYRWMDEARVLESQSMDATEAMGVVDGATRPELPLHIRGSHLTLGEPVSRGFPAVMRGAFANTIFPENQSGRLELANWLASTTNPLTARVMVNRVWGWHFGRPIVPSTENFGALGDRPSHPELLDWLAHSFMRNGWSIKQLHRVIVLSSAYQMSSSHAETSMTESVDPENAFLWKFPIRRLDAEQLRDSLLSVTGRLDESLGGKTVPLRNRQFVFDHTSIDHTRYDSLRRTAYLPIIRNNVYSLLEQFDFPDPTMPTGRRNTTTVAPQSLMMLNSQLVLSSSRDLAVKLTTQTPDPQARIQRLYGIVFGRPPEPSDVERCLSFVEELTRSRLLDATRVDPEATVDAWAMLVQSLMATNEFLYVR
jgi:mono/diheme cytochrome c family protein